MTSKAKATTSSATPTPPPPTPSRTRHHRLSLTCVNDVYSFDDVDSSSAAGIPRGGWCRAATLMKRLGKKENRCRSSRSSRSSIRNEEEGASTSDCDGETTTVLTVANGDVLGGSSLLQHCRGSVAVEVMNSIPIDLAVLGNHEFDYGDEALMERVEESDFPWLGSNVYYEDDRPDGSDSDLPPPRESLDDDNCKSSSSSRTDGIRYFPGIHGDGKIVPLSGELKLGVFGLVTKVTPSISNPSPKVVFDRDVLSVARRTARSLRARGAHVIVAITHMSEAEDRMLAADKAASVDLILGGHEHEPMAAMVHRNDDDDNDGAGGGIDRTGSEPDDDRDGTPGGGEKEGKHNEGGVLVFKCGMNAYWIGTVDLDIEYHAKTPREEAEVENRSTTTTRVASISTSWAMHSVTSRTAEEDPAVSRIVERHRKESDESAMASAFGEVLASTLGLDDVVATIGDASVEGPNNPAAVLPLDTRMSSVRRREATGGNLVADAMHWLLETTVRAERNDEDASSSSSYPHTTTLAMINGGFIRGDRVRRPGTDLTVRDVLTELPFPRTMKVLRIEGRHLKRAMAQQLRGSSRGPTGAYPHLSSNARLGYRLGGPSGADSNDDEHIAIESFAIDGAEVSDEREYVIAVTSFVAEGMEGCISWLEGAQVHNPAWEAFKLSYVLLRYLQCHRVVRPVLEDRVKLAR